ncbi:MAG: hypothetical protein ABI333_01530 [bacterium]
MSATLIMVAALSVLTTPALSQGQGFDHQKALPRPLMDQSLPKGTVSVLVRGIKLPTERVEALVVPADAQVSSVESARKAALVRGTTNEKGRIFLQAGVAAGKQIRAVVIRGKQVRLSVPFELPVAGGARLLFIVGKHRMPSGTPSAGDDHDQGHEHGSPVPSGPTSNDPSKLELWISVQLMGLERDELHVALSYTVLNRGSLTYSPGKHGLFLPTPAGAKGVAVPRGTRGVKVEKRGLVVQQRVATGRHGLRVTCSFRFDVDRSARTVSLSSALPIIGYAVSLGKWKGVYVESDQLGKAQEVEAHRAGAPPTLVYRSLSGAFPSRTVKFQIKGLPVRSRTQSAVFLGLAALLVALGFGVALARPRKSLLGGGDQAGGGEHEPRDRVEPRVEDLVRLEQDRLLGRLDEAQVAARHEEILTNR